MRLETERLVLRKPEPVDLDGYRAMYTDPEVMRFLGGNVVPAEEVPKRVERMFESWDEHGVGLFSVLRKEDERFVGRVGYIVWDTKRWFNENYEGGGQELEIAWTVIRELWNHGYATEAASACRDHAFGALGRDRVISLITPENIPSLRVAEKIGESLEQQDVGGEAFSVQIDLYSASRG